MDPDEIEHTLDVAGFDGDVAAVIAWYGLDGKPNFEDDSSALVRADRGDLLRPDEIERARSILFDARARRVRPGLVDNVLTEWNAMAISILAEAGGALRVERFTSAAIELGRFLLSSLKRADGRWMRTYKGGRAEHLGVATDYAWLCDALHAAR